MPATAACPASAGIHARLAALREARPADPAAADDPGRAAAFAELRRLRARLADLGDGDWLFLWREDPSPEDVPFVSAALARRLRALGGV